MQTRDALVRRFFACQWHTLEGVFGLQAPSSPNVANQTRTQKIPTGPFFAHVLSSTNFQTRAFWRCLS